MDNKIVREVNENIFKAESELIGLVLENLLDREPEVSDFESCSVKSAYLSNQSQLFYQNIYLGMIVHDKDGITLTFIPDTENK